MWQVHSRQCTSRENTRYTKRIKLPGKVRKPCDAFSLFTVFTVLGFHCKTTTAYNAQTDYTRLHQITPDYIMTTSIPPQLLLSVQ